MNLLAFSTRLSGNGEIHPYLAALEIDGRLRTSLIALPREHSYVMPPVHPLYGDLLEGPSLSDVLTAIRSHVEGLRVQTHSDNRRIRMLDELDLEFMDAPEGRYGEQAHSQISALREHQTRKDNT
jgi:hypothetical protein